MRMEIKEIVDRYTILRLKIAHGIDANKELALIQKHLPASLDRKLLNSLYRANSRVWELEAEVGRLALEIRAWNTKRTLIKNKIAEVYGGHKDIKKFYAADSGDHLPEVPTLASKVLRVISKTLGRKPNARRGHSPRRRIVDGSNETGT